LRTSEEGFVMSVPGRQEAVDGSAGGRRVRPTVFRDVNKQILRISREWQVDDPVVVYCECARRNCKEELRLSLAERAAAENRPDCFVLQPGHNDARIERIVETHPNCVLTETVESPALEFVEVVLSGASE
jgi:hypothetical protein